MRDAFDDGSVVESARIDTLEERVTRLAELPGRIDDLTLQVLQLRGEVRTEFSALNEATRREISELDVNVRQAMTELNDNLRLDMNGLNDGLRQEMSGLNNTTLRQMRVLHEDVIARLGVLSEGDRRSPTASKKRPRKH
ncbi:MAG TPA: hypothetical protein VGH34_06580 [Vicinamibacterales bacterium]